MKYVALLRGINVGGKRRVEMKKLRGVFENLGFRNVSTYINSGNVVFESEEKVKKIRLKIELELKNVFNDEFPTLVKSVDDLKNIARSIPSNWQNNSDQRTDVAYLFEEIDNEKILDELPINKELVNIRYIKGAFFWNVRRENVIKSHLAKIISYRLYKFMTIRNVNTARFFGNLSD
jgi:uncharacterized protein (DUF1697 family)